jgi:hypothetical protein
MRSIGLAFLSAATLVLAAAGCDGDVTTGPGGAGGSSTTTSGPGGGNGGQGGAGGQCSTDADCIAGEQWCVGGACVACDNSGLACDILCIMGWTTYERNGCYPCACAPMNQCTSDAACGAGEECYAGQFCWDWCPAGEPSCCYGNTCSQAGCADPNPTGCFTTGCPIGEDCVDAGGCTSSGCFCDGMGWACTDDCGGGTCVATP